MALEQSLDPEHRKTVSIQKGNFGFTLLELLVAMGIACVVIGSIYAIYTLQMRMHRNQQLQLEARQNARAALAIIEQQIRMAGYDPEDSDMFSITDVRRYSLENTSPDPQGLPGIVFLQDANENGIYDGGGERVSFRIRKDPGTDGIHLAWDMGSGHFPMADNIRHIGFAYSIDADRNGIADLDPKGSHRIWAVDSDNDNLLDTNLDANADGLIDERDDANGDDVISAEDGGGLDPPVSPARIKAVRVWLLATPTRPLQGACAPKHLLVGDRLIDGTDLKAGSKVLESIIECRNL